MDRHIRGVVRIPYPYHTQEVEVDHRTHPHSQALHRGCLETRADHPGLGSGMVVETDWAEDLDRQIVAVDVVDTGVIVVVVVAGRVAEQEQSTAFSLAVPLLLDSNRFGMVALRWSEGRQHGNSPHN